MQKHYGVTVTATETFSDYELFSSWMDVLKNDYGSIYLVLDGSTDINDMAVRYASEKNLEVKSYPGAYKVNIVLAFWDGKEYGKEDMVKTITENGVIMYVVYF